MLNALASARQGSIPVTPSIHRLGPGLPGYLIPFAPLAFAPQRQCWSRMPPSTPLFLQISTHFTANPVFTHPSPNLMPCSIRRSYPVRPREFTYDLVGRLRALYAQEFRTTLAPPVLPRLL